MGEFDDQHVGAPAGDHRDPASGALGRGLSDTQSEQREEAMVIRTQGRSPSCPGSERVLLKFCSGRLNLFWTS
jgi:hypothetical protein